MSNTPKHTPGPWFVEKVNTLRYASIGGAYFIRAGKEDYVCRLTDESGDREANAQLIAVAPDLLEALLEVAKAHHGHYVRPHYVTQVLAAIAKAEGK